MVEVIIKAKRIKEKIAIIYKKIYLDQLFATTVFILYFILYL